MNHDENLEGQGAKVFRRKGKCGELWFMGRKVPLADIDLGNDEIDAVVDVMPSKWLTMGEVTRNFEKALS